jgi:hypothetical protein
MEDQESYSVVPYENSALPDKYTDMAEGTKVNINPHLADMLLYDKLDKVKASIGYIRNDKKVTTKRGVSYSYPSIELLESRIQPLLREHNLSYNMNSYVDPTLGDGKMQWMIGTVRIVDKETGHVVEQKYSFPLADSEFVTNIQNYGSTVTYARRYVYIQVFNIMHGDEEPEVVDIVNIDSNTVDWIAYRLVPFIANGLDALPIDKLAKTVHSILSGKITIDKVIEKWAELVDVKQLLEKKNDA